MEISEHDKNVDVDEEHYNIVSKQLLSHPPTSENMIALSALNKLNATLYVSKKRSQPIILWLTWIQGIVLGACVTLLASQVWEQLQ